jgi:hypothetical protein
VSDIEAARAELIHRGVEVNETYHRDDNQGAISGPDPQRRSYATCAPFSDPDSNSWLLQEVTVRLPGRRTSGWRLAAHVWNVTPSVGDDLVADPAS